MGFDINVILVGAAKMNRDARHRILQALLSLVLVLIMIGHVAYD